MRHRFVSRPVAAAAIVAASLGAPSFTAPAHAAAATPVYRVTMVARACATYTSVFANRARNDIMESLRDLGPDTPYSPFVQVQPSVEDGRAPQSGCTPLPGWRFSFGTGIARPAPGTNLSYVTGTSNVANRQVTTLATTPLLDELGGSTGRTIAGAATFTLTSTEAGLAGQSNRFWVMGGAPTDPLNGQGDEYGFAALRCARDNLNGDNVEWIGYPSSVTHVFCYAFYVKPPPGAGTIRITKALATAQDVDTRFDFSGNLSFNEGGRFAITVPAGQTSASVTFTRAETRPGEAPWTVAESVGDGWQLTGLACTSATSGSSTAITGSNPESIVGGSPGHDTASITLAESDTVTCTFTNDLPPPPVGVGRLVKVALGDPTIGLPPGVLPQSWTFNATSPSSVTTPITLQVDPDTGEADTGDISGLAVGTWTVTEVIPPAAPGWRWDFAGASCQNGDGTEVVVPPTASPTIAINVPAGPTNGATCVFANRLVPTGSLTIDVTSIGGSGTFGFDIAALDGGTEGRGLTQSATTTAAGTPATASGDSTDPLLGTFVVTPVVPVATTVGRWVVDRQPSCQVFGAPALNLGDDSMKVVPGNAVAPDLVCSWVFRLVAPSTLDVSKVIVDAERVRTTPVTITATCDDGTTSSLDVAADGRTSASMSQLSFVFPVTCDVVEAAVTEPSATVTTSTAVTVGGVASTRAPRSLDVGSAASAEQVAVTFTNTYTARRLPATGATPWPLVLLGLALVGTGAALDLAGRRRAPG